MKNNLNSQSRISKSTTTIKEKQIKQKQKNTNYLELSNEEFLRRNLMLLGVTQASFLKQTKCSIQAQFFPKNQTNPTGSKQFFYITFFCLEKLTNNDEINDVQMWYPPRTVSEQLQYKKAFFKAVQNLQLLGRVPKNLIISKGTIMGDSSAGVLLQFLRFFSEMALRHQYLQKFSKRQKLIQICCNHAGSNVQNNINKFYIHPFVPSMSTVSFDHPSVNLPLLKQVYHDYLKIYFRKLVKLRTKNINPVLAEMHQEVMRSYMEQKQLGQTLTKKIPSALLSENRSFDRRRMIDKNHQIWNELQKLQLNYVQQKQIPILTLQGEVDQILQKWQPVKGIANILEANNSMKEIPKLKAQVNERMTKFRELCIKIQQKINN